MLQTDEIKYDNSLKADGNSSTVTFFTNIREQSNC